LFAYEVSAKPRDFGHASAAGISWTSFDIPELTVAAVLDALKKGGQPEGHHLSFREGIKKNFANWFRLLNKSRPQTNDKKFGRSSKFFVRT